MRCSCNRGWYTPERQTKLNNTVVVLIMDKNERSILKADIFKEIVQLNEIIQNITISFEGEELRFKDLCAKWKDECIGNEVLGMAELMVDVEMYKKNVTSPLLFFTKTIQFLYQTLFGGTEMVNGTLKSAKATKLAYTMKNRYPVDGEK